MTGSGHNKLLVSVTRSGEEKRMVFIILPRLPVQAFGGTKAAADSGRKRIVFDIICRGIPP